MAFAFRRVLDLFVFVWLFHLSYLTYGVVPNSGIQQLAVSGLAKMALRHLMVGSSFLLNYCQKNVSLLLL